MKYTLFFSYQSDTKHEYDFIKNILNNEVKNALAVNDINLVVDFGMRDVAGNPPLLDIMLRKGEECDIFLVDLTYVTNFTNSSGKKKYVPNPNVMLELGHAWNFHGYSHTIFIHNKAKGVPEDFPVDLTNIRFPISYELEDSCTKPKKNAVKIELAKDLIRAINAVINSIEIGNKTKFLPFEKIAYCLLQNTHNQYGFIITDYFDRIANELKTKLTTNQSIILSGKSSCGKSRIIKEFVCRNFSSQQQNDVLYCKLSQTSSPVLYDTVRRMKSNLARDTYFIIDNCDDTTVNELLDILHGTNHKIIAIIERSQNKEQIKIDAKAYISEIIAIKAPDRWNELIPQNISDVGHIVAILHNNSYQPNTYNVDEDSTKLLGYISLFSKVGFRDHFENDFLQLCQLFRRDINNSRNLLERLITDGYIVDKGGFIFIESDTVANEYAKQIWMQGIAKEITFDALIDKGYLAQSFIERQIQVVLQSNDCSSFLKNIIKTNLRDIAFVDSQVGKHVTSSLAEVFPKETLTSLELLCQKNKEYEFKEIYVLVWAIDKIIKVNELFGRAIQLLLKLKDGNSHNKINFNNLVSDQFKRIHYNYNQSVSLKAFKAVYDEGHIDIVKNVFSSIFNVGYKDLQENQTQYLMEMFLFLVSIRVPNKEWANNIIVKNILAARYLGISRQVFAEIRKIVEENDDMDVNIAETLSNKIRWASSNDKKSIKALLQSMSDRSSRMMLYNKVVLYKSDKMPDRELLKSAMNKIASEVIRTKNWEDDIDILLRGNRKWDANCFWLGYAISEIYDKCEELINRSLNLYRDIPTEGQSHGFFVGLFHKYVSGADFSVFKQKRDELLKKNDYFNLAISLSNACNNTIDDLESIKNSITAHSFSLQTINNLNWIELSETEYISFASELIKLGKDGADTAIKFLYRATKIHKGINISACITEILDSYCYWDGSDYNSDSVYSTYIELLEYTLNEYPIDTVAEKIIESMISGCGNRNFNNNYSIVDLFKILIENYQVKFLAKILPIINDEPINTYLKRDNLAELFRFQNNANNSVFLKWGIENGRRAVEFVAEFIPVFEEGNEGSLQWTEEAKSLISKFSDNSYVLSIISTKLYNGIVSVVKYQRLKKAYDLLADDDNPTVRLWAIEQSENMERSIQREQEEMEVRQVWYR